MAGPRRRRPLDPQGTSQRLEVTEAALGDALHGLLADRAYAVMGADTSSGVLAAAIDARPGYQFQLDTSAAYTLTARGGA